MNLCTFKNDASAVEELNARITSANTTKRKINHSSEPWGATPTFSFLAIEGWACSSGRFSLRKGK